MTSPKPDQPPRQRPSVWAWCALVVALAASAGSVYLTKGMNLKPCPLCYYQRAFALGLVGVLLLGLFGGQRTAGRLGILAMPLALGGLGVAIFHVKLEVTGVLECPAGIFGLGSAPQQSLAAFVLLTILIQADIISGFRAGTSPILGTVLALLVGVGISWVSCNSNPPLPKPPPGGYKEELKVCRPPYVGE